MKSSGHNLKPNRFKLLLLVSIYVEKVSSFFPLSLLWSSNFQDRKKTRKHPKPVKNKTKPTRKGKVASNSCLFQVYKISTSPKNNSPGRKSEGKKCCRNLIPLFPSNLSRFPRRTHQQHQQSKPPKHQKRSKTKEKKKRERKGGKRKLESFFFPLGLLQLRIQVEKDNETESKKKKKKQQPQRFNFYAIKSQASIKEEEPNE